MPCSLAMTIFRSDTLLSAKNITVLKQQDNNPQTDRPPLRFLTISFIHLWQILTSFTTDYD